MERNGKGRDGTGQSWKQQSCEGIGIEERLTLMFHDGGQRIGVASIFFSYSIEATTAYRAAAAAVAACFCAIVSCSKQALSGLRLTLLVTSSCCSYSRNKNASQPWVS